MTPNIYVGVPVYQGTDVIIESLRSIQAQTYETFRAVISVDGPDDPTLEICRSFTSDGRFELQVQPKRLGWPGNFNWLTRDCDLEYFCYWQQDDYATPDYLAELHSTLQASPDAAVAYSDIQWIGDRTDRDMAVDIDGTPIQRCLQAIEALHYLPLRGLVRADRLPDRSDPIPTVSTNGHQQEFVYLAELASAGAFHRAEPPLYYKRAHDASAHQQWLREPDYRRRDEWLALGNELIDVAQRTEPGIDRRRLLGVVLDRLAIARVGRAFWYVPDQSARDVAAFVREFLVRFPERLRQAADTTRHRSDFERPIHRVVESTIAAGLEMSGVLDELFSTPTDHLAVELAHDHPAAWTLGQGWNTPEPWGAWAGGPIAELILPPHAFTRAALIGHPFAPQGAVRVGVSAGDGPITHHECDDTTVLVIDLPSGDARSRTIRLHTPDAVSPHDAGVSADPRRLGFALSSITFER